MHACLLRDMFTLIQHFGEAASNLKAVDITAFADGELAMPKTEYRRNVSAAKCYLLHKTHCIRYYNRQLPKFKSNRNY